MINFHTSRIVREILSLLYWSMLAACTVGPGTVVTCARAGAEFQLSLIYVLVFASMMAYILQVQITQEVRMPHGKPKHTCPQYQTIKIFYSSSDSL